jgi:putative DNA primase/helicase
MAYRDNSARSEGKQGPSYEIEMGEIPPDQRELPIIQYSDEQISKAVDETQDVLIKASKPVFVYAGALVMPVLLRHDAADDREVDVTVFDALNVNSLRHILNDNTVVRYVKYDGRRKKSVEVAPPDKMLLQLLETRSCWKFPRVVGIVNGPTMRRDGSIITQQGYDAATKRYAHWDDNLHLPPIPERPTHGDAKVALQLFLDLLKEFPFENERVDKAVAVATILAAALRPSFDLAPMTVVLAHDSGTGKSYLADLVAIIASGDWCPVINGSESRDEMEKHLSALLLESAPIISLDNLSYDLKGDLLNSMITQHAVKVRVLGKSQTPLCEWRGIALANGNNIHPVADLTRRVLLCNMDAGLENPWQRSFTSNPIGDVLRDRGKFLAAAVTITRAYLMNDKKVKCTPLSGFKEWSTMIREPLISLGMADPVESQDKARKDDPYRNAMREFIAAWKKELEHEARYTVAEVVTLANKQNKQTWDYERPHLHACILAQASNMKGELDAHKLGKWLGHRWGAVYDGYRIAQVTEDKVHGHRYMLQAAPKGKEGSDGCSQDFPKSS